MAAKRTVNATRKTGQTQLSEKTGRSDRYPSDYGVRDREETEREREKDKSWTPGDAGHGREGYSKGYGGSGGKGTGRSGPERK